jgi:hypothetical protein
LAKIGKEGEGTSLPAAVREQGTGNWGLPPLSRPAFAGLGAPPILGGEFNNLPAEGRGIGNSLPAEGRGTGGRGQGITTPLSSRICGTRSPSYPRRGV